MHPISRLPALASLAALCTGITLSASAVPVELTDVVQLDVGGKHACVVTSSGGVKCWGDNYWGQLGDGREFMSRETAGDVTGLTSGVAMVSAAGYHSCALMNTGGVKCWGINSSGQLGDGTTTRRLTPVDVVGLAASAVQVSAGHSHTCAVLVTGAVQCWGRNTAGQLGDGTTVDRTAPTDVVGLGSGVAHVAAAYSHTCARLSDGGARCWGSNAVGELGDGTTTHRLTPVGVESLSAGVMGVTVAGGYSQAQYGPLYSYGHSCAVTVAGGVKCWGSNAYGELGDGTTTNRLTPFDVSGLTQGVAQASAGSFETYANRNAFSPGYTCALTSEGGVKCWGYCRLLGDGNQQCQYPYGFTPTPVNVVGLASGVVAMSTGGEFSCALTTERKVKCWGAVPGYAYPEGSTPVPAMAGTLPQSITFGPAPSIPIGGSDRLLAHGGFSGVPLTFRSLTPSICSLSGVPPDVSGTTVHGLASGMCTVGASQGGTIYYDPAPEKTITFRIGPPASQTITFGPAPAVVVAGVGSLSATASSGLAVSFISNTPSVCSVSGNTVSGLAVGSCTVTAQQNGDALYGPAPQVTQTFAVSANNGTFGMVVAKTGSGRGAVTSSPAGIDCGPACAANFSAGTTVMLAASGDSSSVFSGWSGACSGTGGCSVAMDSAKSVTASFSPNTVVPRLVNISTRTQVLTGDNVLIGGFIIGGTTPKTVIVRARGPSMASQGVAGTLDNPKLDLYSGQTLIASNDDWPSASNAAEVSASGYAPSIGSEAAILTVLDPGPYTAIVSGANGTTGTGIVEVFELDHAESPLVNIATRGLVQTGNDVMIGGFAIQGAGPRTVVVRARGPSLARFGVANTLPNPVIELYSGANVIASNDNWYSAANAQEISSSGFAPENAQEAAILVTLNPGLYTAIVRDAEGNVGVGIVEVFAVP